MRHLSGSLSGRMGVGVQKRSPSRRTSSTVDVLALRHPLQWDILASNIQVGTAPVRISSPSPSISVMPRRSSGVSSIRATRLLGHARRRV